VPEMSGPAEGSSTSAEGPDEDIVTIAVAAQRLNMTRQTLSKAVRSGELPALKTGRIYRLHWPTVMAIMTGVAAPPGSPSGGPQDEQQPRDR
jgi:excisionase family DNA binding protein